MKRIEIVTILVMLLFSAACTNCPNCVCPKQKECNVSPQLECPSCPVRETSEDYKNCPKIIITKNITFTKYVCPNGMVVEDPEECQLPVLETRLKPILTNENGTIINNISVEPACVYGNNGGIVKFKLNAFAKDIWFQLSTGGEYKNIYHASNLYEGSRYFVVSNKLGNADFNVSRNMVYLLRLKFYIPSINQTQFSNEHLVDTRKGSPYMTKKC